MLRVLRRVADADIPAYRTIDSLRFLVLLEPAYGEGPERALEYAEQAIRMREELRMRGDEFIGDLPMTNVLMFAERAAAAVGDLDRAAEYALMLASPEFGDMRPPSSRPSDFRGAAQALKRAGRIEEAQRWYDKAESSGDRYAPWGDEAVAFRLERGRMPGDELGSPEYLDQMERVLFDEELYRHPLDLIRVGRSLASQVAWADPDRMFRVAEELEQLYYEARERHSAEELAEAGAGEAYADVLRFMLSQHHRVSAYVEAAAVIDRMIVAFPEAENMAQLEAERERMLRRASEQSEEAEAAADRARD